MRTAFVVQKPRSVAIRALNYSPFAESFRSSGNGSLLLKEMLDGFGLAWGAVFTRIDCEPEHGVNLLSQVDVFASEPEGRTIRRDSMPKPERHQIKKWQVLLSGAGQMGESTLFGRSIIADDRLAGKYVGPDSVTLNFKQPGSDLSLYTYAFLVSQAGLSCIRACAYGTSIPRVRLDLLEQMPIPLASASTMAKVATHIRTAVHSRELYAREVKSAREVVERLPEMQEALQECGTRKPRAVVWRQSLPTLCAWNVASTGRAYSLLAKSWNSRLGDMLRDGGVHYGPRFARITCVPPHGIDFYSQQDVFLIKPTTRRIVHPGFSDNLIRLPEGAIVAGGQGTLGEGEIYGRVAMVSGKLASSGISQHLLRILVKPDEAKRVFAFLSTTVGFRLLRSTGVGTKLLSMRKDLLQQLPVPDFDATTAAAVDYHVATSMAARDAADTAEAEAVRIIEQEVLPSWLA